MSDKDMQDAIRDSRLKHECRKQFHDWLARNYNLEKENMGYGQCMDKINEFLDQFSKCKK